MTTNPADLVSIGHAIVDVLGHADDAFLAREGLTKGSMELIDEDRAIPLYEHMAARALHQGDILTEISGGSAANTAVVAAVLGAATAFVGKVRDDELGHAYARDLAHVGVAFPTAMAGLDAPATGRSMINVTPDAERTMCTFLGAARGIRLPDIDEALFAGAAVTYVEGYLWDESLAHPALLHAIATVKKAGKRFSFTLSDGFLVDRFRGEFHEMLPRDCDILFANEPEICSLFETDDFEKALQLVAPWCEITTVTRGALGSVVLHNGDVIAVPAQPDVSLIDTTGAGDAYAGGFLAAFTSGLPLDRCAAVGNLAAADVISHLGARPSDALAASGRSLMTSR